MLFGLLKHLPCKVTITMSAAGYRLLLPACRFPSHTVLYCTVGNSWLVGYKYTNHFPIMEHFVTLFSDLSFFSRKNGKDSPVDSWLISHWSLDSSIRRKGKCNTTTFARNNHPMAFLGIIPCDALFRRPFYGPPLLRVTRNNSSLLLFFLRGNYKARRKPRLRPRLSGE